MSVDSRTVQACVAALGEDDTLVLRPKSTRIPGPPGSGTTMEETVARLTSDLAPPDGPLAFEGTLGKGGMGIVRLAVQRSLHRRVAVKTVLPEQRTPAATLEILHEAWVTGALEHPNVAPIYDAKLGDEGEPMIVLRRIEGVEWTELLHDPVAVRERYGAESLLEHNLSILMQVCHAVHFAHSRGIVHRDLKPENVMIGEFGEVYLLDWGIAVCMNDDGSGRMPLAANATDIAGTPAYMAPEMLGVEMGPITPRTDVYLLGALLHELITGKAPHEGSTAAQMVTSILVSNPVFPDTAPAELVEITRRAMAPAAEDRFESAEQLRLALLDYRQHRSSAQLCTDTERRLTRLVDELDKPEPPIGRGAMYDVFGACRFGFREALEMWPGNRAARKGLRHALQAMIEYELQHGEPETAASLLDELEEPPAELCAQVQEAVHQQEVERRRLEALEQLGEDLDAGVGMRTRWLVAGGLGLLWILIPVGIALWVPSTPESHTPAIATAAIMLALMALLAARTRRRMMQTAFNRRVLAGIAIGLFGQLVVSVTCATLGLSLHGGRVLTILVWALAAAMMTVSVDRRLLPTALGYFGACAAGLWLATEARHVLYAMSAGHVVTTANVLAIWWPNRSAPPQRFNAGARGI